MSEMVERVAKAISVRRRALVLATDEELAIIAIAALREPTEAMSTALKRAWKGGGQFGGSYVTPEAAVKIWQAMIDEALK